MNNNCLLCGKEFRTFLSYIKTGRGKYCSNICKGKYMKSKKGKDVNSWKGGKFIDYRGYAHIRKPEHPFNNNGYVLEHRLVMEKYIGRYLNPQEVVDHINGVKDDNRIENLKLFSSQGEHITEEGKRGVYKGTHQNQNRNERGVYI